MAEQFLTLMADLDDDSQTIMSAWYNSLIQAGFRGTQTPNLPFHISMASFPLEKEQEAAELIKKIAGEFSPIPVHISHIGIFPGGRVLFGAPERSAALTALHESCDAGAPQPYPWTPHATLLIDKPETICAAVPVLVASFAPFVGKIIRLHLCAFWPTREIASLELTGGDSCALPPELSDHT